MFFMVFHCLRAAEVQKKKLNNAEGNSYHDLALSVPLHSRSDIGPEYNIGLVRHRFMRWALNSCST